MSENEVRSRGRAQNYKFDRGGTPAEMGPFVGIVVSNVDSTRQGRLFVAIEEFGAVNKDGSPNLTDKSLWRTVRYCPPFYGATPLAGSGTSEGTGTYPGNRNTYGMWFTPPDVGVKVICFFIGGDPEKGYYMGVLPDDGQNHMIPAIGAVDNYVAGNKTQETYFTNDPRLPVAEINQQNKQANDNPKFYDQKKPIHSYVAAILFQQGLNKDLIRGPIASSSQRESPSNCYGISTPGRAIYEGGLTDDKITEQLKSGAITPEKIKVIGRRGGHSLVMDDGALDGSDNLIRIRTAKGHQITMSDNGNAFYICHANGQTWLEFGQEGTVDVYATNSVNVRSQGTINLHADKDVNIFAGEKLSIKSKKGFALESEDQITMACKKSITLFAETNLGFKANGSLAVKSKVATIDGGAALGLKGMVVNLNGGPTLPVATPKGLTKYLMPDTTFNTNKGWNIQEDALESICTRAPTHEPWPYHNKGVQNKTELEAGASSVPPAASAIPDGFKITKQ